MFHFKNCHNITFGFFEILSNYFSALAFFPLPLLPKKEENKARYKTFKNSVVTEKKTTQKSTKKFKISISKTHPSLKKSLETKERKLRIFLFSYKLLEGDYTNLKSDI